MMKMYWEYLLNGIREAMMLKFYKAVYPVWEKVQRSK